MSDTGVKIDTKQILSDTKRWLPVIVGVMVVAAGMVWHFLSEGQPPEEQRWANGDIHVISGAHFDEVRAYKLTAAAGATDMTAEQRGWEDPNVAVYSTPNSKPPPAPVTLEKLSDTGQAHAIDYLAKDAGKADTAWLQLAKTLTGPDGGVEKKDPYRADRVLVATVSKGLDAMPGDRLLWSRVFVQPINFEFAGYTVASTDTKTIKVADIENTNNSKLSLGYGLDTLLPGISKDTPAPSIENTIKATAAISQQYESLGVDIRPEFLRIIRESAAGADVVGNTAIELSMLTNPITIWKTPSNDQGKAINDDASLALVLEDAHLTNGMNYLEEPDAKITVHPQNVLPHCPLLARVWMIYEMRKVLSGQNHYLEGLQTVQLVKNGEVAHDVELVRADDIAPAVWSIRRQSVPGESGAPSTVIGDLRASTPNGTKRKIVTTDYLTASELAHWLKAHEPGKKLHELSFDYQPHETLVPFKNIRNDCKQG